MINIKKSICTLLVLISFGNSSYANTIFQKTEKIMDSLAIKQERFRFLEKELASFKKLEIDTFQKYVSEHIPLALELQEYEKATRLLILVFKRFQSLRAHHNYLQLCHSVEPYLSEAPLAKPYLPNFYINMANAYRRLRKKEEQIHYYSKVIDLNNPQDSLVTAKALFIRGQSYSWSGKFLTAIKDFMLASVFYNRLQDTIATINVEKGMLLLFRKNGFGGEVISRRISLIDRLKSLQHKNIPPLYLPLEYLNLASDYEDAGDLHNYEINLLKAIEEAKNVKDLKSKPDFLYITSYALLSELYLQKDLKKSLVYLEEAKKHIAKGRDTENSYHMVIYHLQRVKLLIASKKFREAISILMSYIKKGDIRESNLLVEIYELMSTISSLQNEHLKALQYYRIHQNLKDSIFSVSKTNSLFYYQTLYDIEKKEKEIAYQELNLQSQDAIITQQNRQRIYFIVGSGVLLLFLFGAFFFIKKIRAAKKKVAASLSEKELLLKEIHHRVKNNLQIVYGLMHKQARVSNDYTFKALMEDAQSRIKSMAIIHQKLYQNNTFSEVDMKGYISELVKDIDRSFATSNVSIDVKLQMVITKFHMDIAIPLGLILNELITNIYKHAFSNGEGKVLVSIEKVEGQHQIIVKDNGVGLLEGIDLKRNSSLGMNLIVGLCHQIRATFDYKNNNGSEFTIVLNNS